jgi:iron complex outermembrane receptor protein
VNNANAEWLWQAHGFVLRNRVGAVQRYQRDAYAVWDLSLARERGWIHPYLQATNLSNTGYEEIEGVRMQGRSVAGGLELVVARR